MPNYCLITEAALVALCKNVTRTRSGPNKTGDKREKHACCALCCAVLCPAGYPVSWRRLEAKAK